LLHRSFPEADIHQLAQHFDLLDGGIADGDPIRCSCANDHFRKLRLSETVGLPITEKVEAF
tara:strand:+ start:2199 stop:2381 length:183 start_codon:yes stop_codon:yes gene_type:complete